MTTPPPTPVMTLDETKTHINMLLEQSYRVMEQSQMRDDYDPDLPLFRSRRHHMLALTAALHYLEAGNRLREAVENLRDQKGRYNTGAAYDKLMALLSPQPSQQPAPYYTGDGKPLQYHEVSGGGGCGAIPVEPPKQSPQA